MRSQDSSPAGSDSSPATLADQSVLLLLSTSLTTCQRRSLEQSMRDEELGVVSDIASAPDIGDRGSDMDDCDCLDMHDFCVQLNSSLDDESD